MRSPCTITREEPLSPQLQKAPRSDQDSAWPKNIGGTNELKRMHSCREQTVVAKGLGERGGLGV